MMTRTARPTRRTLSPIRATDLFPTSEQIEARARHAADVRAWYARLDAIVARTAPGAENRMTLDDARAEMAAMAAEAARLGI